MQEKINTNEHFWPVIGQSIGSTLISWVQGTGLVFVYMIPSFFPLFWGQKKLPYAVGLLLVLLPLGILKAKKFINQKNLDKLAKATRGVRFVNGSLSFPEGETWIVDKDKLQLFEWKSRVPSGSGSAYLGGIMLVIKLSESRKFVLWSEGNNTSPRPANLSQSYEAPGSIATSNNRLQLHSDHLLNLYQSVS